MPDEVGSKQPQVAGCVKQSERRLWQESATAVRCIPLRFTLTVTVSGEPGKWQSFVSLQSMRVTSSQSCSHWVSVQL